MTSERTVNILAVDDTPANLSLLSGVLKERGYAMRPVPSGELALRAAKAEPPDLILLDIAMPEMDGFEVCARLKADPLLKEIPVIFLTAHTDVADKVKAFSVGGVDYLTKPFQPDEVHARVATHLAIADQRRSLRESYERLAELEKLRDSLVHMVVHDLRSPLATLAALLDLLQHDLAPLSEQSEKDLADCQVATAQMIEMVTSVLDVSKLEAVAMKLELTLCDIAAHAEDVVASMRAVAAGRTVVVSGGGAVLADRSLLPRIIQNLVSNALRFTPRGGVITIAVEKTDALVRFAIDDEGPGVPEAARRSIFEKFGALDRGPHGGFSTGLGLAFCRLAVEAHGGEIGVESRTDGRGSTFWFTLPNASKKS